MKVINVDEIKPNSVILFDPEQFSEATIRTMFAPLKGTGKNIKAIPIWGDIENALSICNEESMNAAGWYRKDEEEAET